MMKVSKRGGFSDRNAIKPENVEIQLKEFDQRTRTQLQNMLSELYVWVYGEGAYWGRSDIQNFFRYVLGTIYAQPVDSTKGYTDTQVFRIINETIENDDYDDVLTLTEAVIQYWDEYLKKMKGSRYVNACVATYGKTSLFEVVNHVFEREYIGYRFIDGMIAPISDSNEVQEIKAALANKYQPIRDHLHKATILLSDRDNPDYENSIKESISAVEAICEIITGIQGKEATLGKMLKKMEESGIEIHGGLKSAFNTLYGYTSDANGIRHAGDIGGPSSSFEEAKFMLVSCSAFVNYLMALSSKIKKGKT